MTHSDIARIEDNLPDNTELPEQPDRTLTLTLVLSHKPGTKVFPWDHCLGGTFV